MHRYMEPVYRAKFCSWLRGCYQKSSISIVPLLVPSSDILRQQTGPKTL